jgi:hypothetical protein
VLTRHIFHPAARPTLFLGLVGFTPSECEAISSQMHLAPVGGVHWRVAAYQQADAWVVNGSRTHVLSPDEVSVQGASEAVAPLRMRLPDVDRPVAFSRPFAEETFEPACSFDMRSTGSLVVMLARFSQWLRAKAMLLALADLLTQHAAAIRRRSRVYHLVCDGRLVGVIDLQGDIAVLPEATLGDLARASWSPRPDAAGYVPDNFARKSLAGLLWEYAGRTQRDLLPARYREVPIHLKRTPLLGHRLFTDAHLYVLRELAKGPRTFAQLCAADKFAAQDVARALTSFYLVGCITSRQARADASRHEPYPSVWPWWMSQHPQHPARAGGAHAAGELHPAH